MLTLNTAHDRLAPMVLTQGRSIVVVAIDVVLVGHNYKWLLLWLERHNFFLINAMLFSLLLSLVAHAAGIAESLIVSALLVDDELVRRWHFLQQQVLSREQQRYSKPPHTLSTSSRSILHTRSSFHIRHFHYRHPYTRLQHRLEHVSRTNLTYHMT